MTLKDKAPKPTLPFQLIHPRVFAWWASTEETLLYHLPFSNSGFFVLLKKICLDRVSKPGYKILSYYSFKYEYKSLGIQNIASVIVRQKE